VSSTGSNPRVRVGSPSRSLLVAGPQRERQRRISRTCLAVIGLFERSCAGARGAQPCFNGKRGTNFSSGREVVCCSTADDARIWIVMDGKQLCED
jgi:hypothetical protein